MRIPRLTLAVAGCVVAIDAVSKLAVSALLRPGQIVHAGSLLELDLYYNHAGARNSFTGRPVLVSLLSAASIALLVVMAMRARSAGFRIGIGLLLGGGVGNLADRIVGAPAPLRGGVIDWLRPLHSSGSINLADLAINLGLVVLGLTLVVEWWLGRRRGARSPRPGTWTSPGLVDSLKIRLSTLTEGVQSGSPVRGRIRAHPGAHRCDRARATASAPGGAVGRLSRGEPGLLAVG